MDTPSILDPVTGLPLDQYSGIVQQIPLGQQVFPFADLDADGRMTRQPIYGDDVLPTTSLITGQDATGAARAGTMDTARRLYTREAVFQNQGQKIPDGTTAPIDVNVIGGGGGGGGGPTPQEWQHRGVGGIIPNGGGQHTFPGTAFLGAAVVIGWEIAYGTADNAGVTVGNVSAQILYLEDTVTFNRLYLGTFHSQFYTGTEWVFQPVNLTVFPPVPADLRPNALAGGGDFSLIATEMQVDIPLFILINYYLP